MASPVDAQRAARVDATVREPWHKPTFHDLTDYMDTGGSPTDKDHSSVAIRAEDEARPSTVGAKQKMYRPFSA